MINLESPFKYDTYIIYTIQYISLDDTTTSPDMWTYTLLGQEGNSGNPLESTRALPHPV